MSGATWRFIRHYLEMVAAMIGGMVAVGAASALLLDLPDRTAVRLVEMASLPPLGRNGQHPVIAAIPCGGAR